MASHRVRALLMGGQACVFYGGAEFSRDTDLLILADTANLARLEAVHRWPRLAQQLAGQRPLLRLAQAGQLEELREALSTEEQAERQLDHTYWQPLKEECGAIQVSDRQERSPAMTYSKCMGRIAQGDRRRWQERA